MRTTLAAAALAMLAAPAIAQDYAFEGQWDCDGSSIVLTATTYQPGNGSPIAIAEVEEYNGAWGITLANGGMFGLMAQDDGTMLQTWPDSGDAFSCRRM